MRRPISLNIYGITGLLLMLMALVALISSINFSRVDRQTTLLSAYYIPLDQTLSDIRDHNLIQALLLEPGTGRPCATGHAPAGPQDRSRFGPGTWRCNYETYAVVSRKLFASVQGKVDPLLLGFEFNRYCADGETQLAGALVNRALSLPCLGLSRGSYCSPISDGTLWFSARRMRVGPLSGFFTTLCLKG